MGISAREHPERWCYQTDDLISDNFFYKIDWKGWKSNQSKNRNLAKFHEKSSRFEAVSKRFFKNGRNLTASGWKERGKGKIKKAEIKNHGFRLWAQEGNTQVRDTLIINYWVK